MLIFTLIFETISKEFPAQVDEFLAAEMMIKWFIISVMTTSVNLSIRNATHADRYEIANLIHFGVHIHRHLDWKQPLEWVGSQPFLIAEYKGKLIATLACPPDIPQVAWIRLFAVLSDDSLESIWKTLWQESSLWLSKQNEIEWAAAIPLQSWFQSLLYGSTFTATNQVVMLRWDVSSPIQRNSSSSIIIRPMTADDLYKVAQIDTAAFVPLWQISQVLLEDAFHQAAIATIAECDGEMVGYQISTVTIDGGHLARLAVHPLAQKNGVGTALLRDLLLKFERRGARILTVNTQSDNLASLSLYQKAGFRFTGDSYAVCRYAIHA